MGAVGMGVGLGGLALLGASAHYIRRSLPSRVNCWFCNTDSRVPFTERNSWTCSHCSQYNGFTESGDYNRELPEQRYEALNGRHNFAASIPTSDEETSHVGNGLCRRCNDNQALKVAQLAAFRPTNPEKEEMELGRYRSRLERVYALCAPCELSAQGRLRDAHRRLHLPDPKAGFRSPTSPRVRSARGASSLLSGSSSPLPRKRTKWVAVGGIARLCQLATLALSALLAAAAFHTLQEQSHAHVIDLEAWLPHIIIRILTWTQSKGFYLSLYASSLQTLAMYSSQARLLHADLIALFCWLGLVTSHLYGWGDWSSGASRLCLASSACLFAFWAAVLPRKRIRTSKPKLAAAVSLSVASTPESQCTTALGKPRCNGSTTTANGGTQFNGFTHESPMEVSDSEDTCSIFKVPETGPLLRKRGGRAETPGREPTPSRVLAGQLDSLSFPMGEAGSEGRGREGGGPFGSLRLHAGAIGLNAETASLFTSPPPPPSTVFSQPKFRPPPSVRHFMVGTSSWVTSVSQRAPNPNWSPGSNMTSVSQHDYGITGVTATRSAESIGSSSSTGDWKWKWFMGAVMAGSLMTNLIVVWLLLRP